MMSDRHEKWVRVEPGTVIPAGQPYRIEYGNGTAFEYGSGCLVEVTAVSHGRTEDWFIDSSWKPPLVLPTEPTWGIAVHIGGRRHFGEWRVVAETSFSCTGFSWTWGVENIAAFIPLTPEQVARIEAAR